MTTSVSSSSSSSLTALAAAAAAATSTSTTTTRITTSSNPITAVAASTVTGKITANLVKDTEIPTVIRTTTTATVVAPLKAATTSSSSVTVTTAKKTASIQKMPSRSIPADKINLRLILVSGKTKEFLFSPSDSAGDIAQTVFDNWPEDWESEMVSKAEILRLIYQGRFLHCNVTLGALGLPLGKTTVMHLVPRDNLPEPNSQDQRQKSKGGSSRCCSTTCCIL